MQKLNVDAGKKKVMLQQHTQFGNGCVEEGISLLQLALQFCLKEERIQGNNIGSLNAEQLEANLRAASTPLPDEVWEKYEAQLRGN